MTEKPGHNPEDVNIDLTAQVEELAAEEKAKRVDIDSEPHINKDVPIYDISIEHDLLEERKAKEAAEKAKQAAEAAEMEKQDKKTE